MEVSKEEYKKAKKELMEEANKPDPKLLNEALEKFRDKNLLNLILEELSKTHIGDDKLKMTLHLVCVSGLLKKPKLRQSMGIVGDTTVGKNNVIETNLEHMPKEKYLYVSNATQSVLEDDLKGKTIIAFKEINFNKEDGANKHLLEIIKQVTEGGTSAFKKDIRTGFKTARHEEDEQKTVIYPTTETERDPEGETRFIYGNASSDINKIKKVNDKTCDDISDLDKIFKDSLKKDSWIRVGLTYFSTQNQYEIYQPYAKLLKEQIKGNYIFDHSSPRSQRDIKRIIALTCAITYLFQEQREKIDYNGISVLVGIPQDFINALKISSEFFNQSYSGLDDRLTEVLKIIKDYNQDWFPRDKLQDKKEEGGLEISRNTAKTYCQKLADEGLIEGTSGKELNEKEGIKVYDSNKIYYKRCQKGVKKPLIRCQINELKEFLEQETKKHIDTFDFDRFIDDKQQNNDTEKVSKEGCQNEGKGEIDSKREPILGEIDTFSLTPFKIQECKPEEFLK